MAQSFILDPMDMLNFLPSEDEKETYLTRKKKLPEYPLVEKGKKAIADMPIAQLARGEADVSAKSLTKALRDIKPFEGGSEAAYESGLNALNPMAKAFAGVIKGKGGNWLSTEGISDALHPTAPPWGNDAQSRVAFRKFDEQMAPTFQKRRDKWIKTDLGSEGDPLKDVPIGELPFTWGDYGDAAVHVAKPENLTIGSTQKRRVNEVGDIVRNDAGQILYDPHPYAEYNTRGVSGFYNEENPKLVEALRAWKENPTPEGQPYLANTPEATGRNLAAMRRETPRSQYIEGNPEWREGAEGVTKWLSGDKVHGPVPEWMEGKSPEDRKAAIGEEIFRTVSEMGEYAGHYKQPRNFPKPEERDFDLNKDYREDFPTSVKQWPKEYDRLEKRNVDRNLTGMEPIKDSPEAGGMRWMKPTTADALQRQAKLMRNCAGGKCGELEEGTLEFMNLVDQYGYPSVMASARVQKPQPIIPDREDWGNAYQGLRDPRRYMEDWRGVEVPENTPRQGPVQDDPDLMARIMRLGEMAQNPQHYGNFLDQNPEMYAILQRDAERPGKVLAQLLPPEDWERVKHLFTAEGKPTKEYSEIKGRANQPVSPRHHEMLAELLRRKGEEIKPGRLLSGEGDYAGHIAVPNADTPGGFDYKSIDEAKRTLLQIVEEAYQVKRAEGSDWRNTMRQMYGRRMTNYLEDLMSYEDIPQQVQGLDAGYLARIFGNDN